jgi:hypothetical protein
MRTRYKSLVDSGLNVVKSFRIAKEILRGSGNEKPLVKAYGTIKK